MIEELNAQIQAAEIADTAEWIVENLQNDGMSCGLAIHSLGFAIALLVAGQSAHERELLDVVIQAIRNAFEDTISAKSEVLNRCQHETTTLQ